MSNCSRCRYAGSQNETGNVECHRYPPSGRVNVFPLMRPIDWCGEWVRSANGPIADRESPPLDAEDFTDEEMREAFHKAQGQL